MQGLMDFLYTLEKAGIEYTSYSEGIINRCTTSTSKSGSKPAWFLYHITNDNCYGVYGDFRSGITNYFPDAIEKKDKKVLLEFIDKNTDESISEITFNYIFNSADKPSSHPYLEKKHINVNAIAPLIKQRGNRLIIPVNNREKNICGIQYIFSEKQGGTDKRFEPGSKQKESFFIFPSQDKSRIIICEGWATAYSVWVSTGHLTFCAFSSGNIINVAKLVREKFPHTKIIIGADHDQVNETTKKSAGLHAAESVVRHVDNSMFVYPRNIGEDFSDTYVKHGAEAVKQYFVTQPSNRLQRGAKFIEARWLIEPFIECGSLFFINGEPGHGKSFFALYLALTAANNSYFYSNKIENDGSVLYICGEDFNGVNRRVIALCDKYNLKDDKFIITTDPVHLLADEELGELTEDLAILKNSGEHIKLIIIDTLNANFGDGDENKTVDATRFINACKRLMATFEGVSVGLVHHTGHEHKNRPRGSSAFVGAANTIMMVNKSEMGEIYISCTKQKNAAPFSPLVGDIKNHTANIDSQKIESAVFCPISDGNISDKIIDEMYANSEQDGRTTQADNIVRRLLAERCIHKMSLIEMKPILSLFMGETPLLEKIKYLEEHGMITKDVDDNLFYINS